MDKNDQSSDKNGKHNRRNVLKAVGVAGASTVIGTGSASARSTEESDDKLDVNARSYDLRGAAKRQVLGQAEGHPDFEALRSDLNERGAEAKLADAKAFSVRHPEEGIEYAVLQIPFATGDEQRQSYVLWSDSQSTESVGVVAEPTPASPGVEYELWTARAVDGETLVTERQITTEQVRKMGRQIGGYDSNGCPGGFPNCNINFECVGEAAGKAGVLAGACGSCASGFVPACFACVGSGILFVNTDCCMCHGSGGFW